MPRPEKVAAVADIKERIERAQAVFLAEYAGLSVKAQQDLRRGLREQGAEFKVVKMTLTRRAAAELDLGDLDELLVGPTGIAFADGDPVNAAKMLKEFAASHEAFAIKGGLLGTSMLSPERVKALAEIAPREVLLAQIAGGLKAPLTAMAGLLAALPRSAATVFQQLLEKKDGAQETPAPDAESADAATDVATPEAPASDDGDAAAPEDAKADAHEEAEDAQAEVATAVQAEGSEAEEAAVEADEPAPAADEPAPAAVETADDNDEDADGNGDIAEDTTDETPPAKAADVGDDDQEPAGEAEEE